MDFTRYSALKAKGLITLSKVGNAHAATVKRYSAEDGRETATETEGIDKAVLENVIARRKKELDSLTELLTDLP
jgi:hypothetical protein